MKHVLYAAIKSRTLIIAFDSRKITRVDVCRLAWKDSDLRKLPRVASNAICVRDAPCAMAVYDDTTGKDIGLCKEHR